MADDSIYRMIHRDYSCILEAMSYYNKREQVGYPHNRASLCYCNVWGEGGDGGVYLHTTHHDTDSS